MKPTDPLDRFAVEVDRVTDRRTGLAWCRDAGISEFPLTWSEAFAFIRDLNADRFGGQADWRLPNRRELFSIVSHDRINPSLPDGHPFENVFAGYYWTSTTCARLPDQAWYVHLGGARIYRGMKHASCMVWPVRMAGAERVRLFRTGQATCHDDRGNVILCDGSGQDGELRVGDAWPTPRFSLAEEAVADRLTGLSWTQDADPARAPVDWEAAAEVLRRMNVEAYAGYADWRLPHIRELETLVDMGTHSPALPDGHPFLNVRDFYWSGSTSRYEERYAWALYLRDGGLGIGYKADPGFHVWPVRG